MFISCFGSPKTKLFTKIFFSFKAINTVFIETILPLSEVAIIVHNIDRSNIFAMSAQNNIFSITNDKTKYVNCYITTSKKNKIEKIRNMQFKHIIRIGYINF